MPDTQDLQPVGAEPKGFQEPVFFMPNPKEPKMSNVMVPWLNLFELPEVKGWDADDYRNLQMKLKPFEDEIIKESNRYQIDFAKSMEDFGKSIGGVKRPDGVWQFTNNEQIQQFETFQQQQAQAYKQATESLNAKANQQFTQALKDTIKPNTLKRIERKHEAITKGVEPKLFEATLPDYDPDELTKQDTEFARIQNRIDVLNQKLSETTDADVNQREVLQNDISNLERQKALYSKPGVQQDQVDFTGVKNVYVDGKPADINFAYQKAYNLDNLKEGDIILAPEQKSMIPVYRKRGDKLIYFNIPVQQRFKDEDGKYGDQEVYSYRVWNKDGELRLEPQLKPSVDQGNEQQPVAKDVPEVMVQAPGKSNERPELKRFMSELEKEDPVLWGSFSSLTGSGGMEWVTNTPIRDGQAIANFLYNRPKYAKEFAAYVADYIKNKEEGAFQAINTSSPLDWKRMIDMFNKSKSDEIEQRKEALGISPVEYQNFTEATNRAMVNQQAFQQYSNRIKSEITAVEEQLKQSPNSQALKERRNKLVATYNKSYENYSEKYRQLSDYIGQFTADPNFAKYVKLDEEKAEVSRQNFLLGRMVASTAPTIQELEDSQIQPLFKKEYDGVANPISAGFRTLKGAAIGTARFGLGLAGIFDDPDTIGYIDFLKEKNANNLEALKYNEKRPDGSTNWNAKVLNWAVDAGGTIPDLVATFVAPEIRAAGWAKNLPGAVRRFPGLWLTMGLPQYNDAYEEAKNAGIQSVAGRRFYALMSTAVEAATESFFDLPGFVKGINKEAIDQFRTRARGYLMENLDDILRVETREKALSDMGRQIGSFARNLVSKQGIGEAANMFSQEFLIEENLSLIGKDLLNTSTNAITGSKLDEDIFTFNNVVDMLGTGLILAPLLSAPRSWNGASLVYDRESNIYRAIEQHGFSNVYKGISLLKKQIDEGKTPEGVDEALVNKLYTEMPYINTLSRPADIPKEKWTLISPFMARYKMAEEKMKESPGPLKEGYRTMMKEASEKIAAVMGLSEEQTKSAIQEIDSNTEATVKDVLKKEQPTVEQPVESNQVSNEAPVAEVVDNQMQQPEVVEQNNEAEELRIQQVAQVEQELRQLPTPEQVETQKTEEINAASKPVFNMEFTPEKQLGNKKIKVTFEDAETGEQTVREVPAGKLQASVKARFEVMQKISNCIG